LENVENEPNNTHIPCSPKFDIGYWFIAISNQTQLQLLI
jgi:hypothetical protein